MIRYAHVWSIALLLLIPSIALAGCPTGVQKTVVIYLNGVDTTEESAWLSINKVKKEVFKVPYVIQDCLEFDYLYNTNEKLFGDLIEAGLQKAKEQNLSTSDFWRWFFRLNPFTFGFSDLIFDYYSNTNTSIDLGLFVLGDQVEEHLAKIREHLSQGKRIIIVSHSQGVLYANDEWNLLTNSEKSQVNVIAVATPTDHIAGNGPHTTLYEDWIANNLFPHALAANVANDESCPDYWTCHGFKESYMRGENSRSRIVDQIVSLLPTPPSSCRIEGTVRYFEDNTIVSGIGVTLNSSLSGNLVFQTTSDSNGYYCIGNVADGDYFLEANIGYYSGFEEATLPGANEPLIIDIMLAAPM